jgi:D-alanine-D-alanine ligase
MESEDLPIADLTWKVPCVVKPVLGGSSVGVSIVKNVGDMEKAKLKASEYGEIMIEEYIEGIEVSCGVLGNPSTDSGQVALPVIEIRPKNDFFDYEAKYSQDKCEEICPAELEERVTLQVQKLAVEVFKVIGGRGFARVDFIVRNNKPFILEINTIPGMTLNSLLPREALVAGISYVELLDKMIDLALE